jgi:exonuclease SbcC
MIPETLTLENFGPYVQETLDFRRFAEVPLFLISGKTGSGKSTMFDAMRFALYGDGGSDQGERDGSSLRSNFAGASDPTVVTFTFTQGEKRYVVKRQPKQVLKKKRGKGNKIVNADAVLSIYEDGKEVNEFTKTRDVDTRLQALLGLTAEQFTQIVLLPQGEFRRFLNADSNEKEAVLRQLFGTGKYQRWGDIIHRHAAAAQGNVVKLEQQLSQTLSGLPWPAEMSDQVTPFLTNPLVYFNQLFAALTELVAAQAAQVTSDQTQQQTAQKALTAAQNQWHAGQELAKQQQEAAQLLQQQAALDEQKDDMAALASHIQQLEFAQTLQSVQQQQIDGQTHLAQAQSGEKAAQTQLQTADGELTAINAQLTKLNDAQKTIDQAKRQADQLTGLLPQFAKVAQAKAATDQAERAAKQAAAAVTEQKTALTVQQEELAKEKAAAEQLPTLTEAKAELIQQAGVLAASQEHLTRVQQQLSVWQASQAKRHQAHQALTAAQADEEQAAADYRQTKSDWAAGQIARLSQDLVPGTPCPVCGSPDHPHPAPVDVAVLVSDAQLKKAETRWQKQSRQSTQWATQVQAYTTQVETAAEQLQNAWAAFTSVPAPAEEAWTTALATAQQHLTAQQAALRTQQQANAAALKTAQTAQNQVTQLQNGVTQLTTAVETAQTAAQTANQQAIAAKTTWQDAQEQLPAEYPNETALKQVIAQLTAQIDAHTQALAAAQQNKETAQNQVTRLTAQIGQLQQEQSDWQQRLATYQQKITAALAAHQPAVSQGELAELLTELPQLVTLRHQLTDYQNNQTTVTAQLAQVQKNIAGRPQPDVAALQAAVTTAQQTADAASQALYAAQTAQQQSIAAKDQMKKMQAAQTEQLQVAAEWNSLDETVNGKGTIKLSLERYVLRAYLKEVLTVANQRLAHLTGGRYELQLHRENGAYATNTGLELDVYDDNVGATRSVHTLSGGESFLTALSLALALGEVVQNESGGIQINALFVDEGFGSLDEDALNSAIDALQSIEGRQRLIGIISHVRELRQQIPDQLWVETEGDGRSRLHYPTSAEIEAKAL